MAWTQPTIQLFTEACGPDNGPLIELVIDTQSPDNCSSNTLACGALPLQEIIALLQACAGDGAQLVAGQHTIYFRAVDATGVGPASPVHFELGIRLDDIVVGDWFLDDEIDAVLQDPLGRGRDFVPSYCEPDVDCFRELHLPDRLNGVHRIAFRVGRRLLGYDLCFGPTSILLEQSAANLIYWGLLKEELVYFPATQSHPYRGLIASDAVLGEDCDESRPGDEDMDGQDNLNDWECRPPGASPLVELALDGQIACGVVTVAEFPQITSFPGQPRRAVLHVYGSPGETIVGEILLDLAPPVITQAESLLSCEMEDGISRVVIEWDSAAGFSAFEIVIDDRTVSRLDDPTARQFTCNLAPGQHRVAVIGFRPHPNITEGIGYKSSTETVSVAEPCLDVTVRAAGDDIEVWWAVPKCLQFFDQVTLQIDEREAVPLQVGNGCTASTTVSHPGAGAHTFMVRGFFAGNEICCSNTVFPKPSPTTEFKRGDTDGNGTVDITDGIRTLGYLFLGDSAPPCQDALDADDSGILSISDGIYVLNFLFRGGSSPPAPGPFCCGPDPTADRMPLCSYDPTEC